MPYIPPPFLLLFLYFCILFVTHQILHLLHLFFPPCLSCCLLFSPPASCFLAPSSCRCAIMELNLTPAWMVHKKQLIAHLWFFFFPSIFKSFRSPSDRLSTHRNACSQAKICVPNVPNADQNSPPPHVRTGTCHLTMAPRV